LASATTSLFLAFVFAMLVFATKLHLFNQKKPDPVTLP
jgi:hypothetical protein